MPLGAESLHEYSYHGKAVCGWHPVCRSKTQGDLSGTRRDAMGLDPVCKMEVNPASAEALSDYEGVTFYFCSQACKEKFDREPLRYVDQTDLAEMRVRRANPAA